MKNTRKQKGAALLLAITVTAFMTILVSSLMLTQQISLRQTANILHGDQALQFTLAIERLGIIMLRRDRKENKVDHLMEPWAHFATGVAMIQSDMPEHITLFGQIEDLQARYNLNNLIDAKGSVSKVDLAMFKRLLETLELDEQLASAVVDWIDKDINPSFPDGAEDGDYLNLDIPYRTPNRFMVSPTELYLIKGVNAKIYQKLAPFITVLPKRSKINVNTAPAELLTMLTDKLSLRIAKDIVKDRTENRTDGFAKVGDFAKLGAVRALLKKDKKLKSNLIQNFSVETEFFMIASVANFGEGTMQLFSTVQREKNKTRVVHRGQGGY